MNRCVPRADHPLWTTSRGVGLTCQDRRMVDEHIRRGVHDPLGVGDWVLYGARLAACATESNPVAKA